MPLDTGHSSTDAREDFTRARRAQVLSRLARRMSRGASDVDVILPFDEVVAELGRVGERDLGLHIVAVDSIVGTVDRRTDFDRQFRPTTQRLRGRWERIARAARRGEALPPISLYRVGEVHFVRDGHHRVSVARAQGRTDIDAYVTEVLTRVGAERSLRLSDLPLKGHERLFHERVPLPPPAAARLKLTDPWRYGDFAEGVEAWGFRVMQERGTFMDRPAAARAWFDEEFVPVVRMLHEAGLVLADETEADVYVRLGGERYRVMRTMSWSADIVSRLPRGR